MVKIIVDAFGGDNSPYANVEGAIKAIKEIEDLHVTFTGNEEILKQELAKYDYDAERVGIINATEIITCEDKPTDAVRIKKDSSLVKAIDYLRTTEDVSALVSSGSTGAVLAGAVLRVGRINGVKRPAFCPILPNVNGGIVAICDSGANVDCSAEQLVQFAVMGSVYLEKTYGIDAPRVALLNNGTEDTKGDALRKETFALLKNAPSLNFVGNMESRDLLSGGYDLIVCDGFAGNVLLKSTEGACLEMLKLLKKTLTKGFKNKMGALLLKKDIYKLKDFMDYNNYGGGVMLGAAKTVIKAHGSSKAKSIYECCKQAYAMEKASVRGVIGEKITEANAYLESIQQNG